MSGARSCRHSNILPPLSFNRDNINDILPPLSFRDNYVLPPLPPLQDVSDFRNMVTRNVRNFMYPGLPGVDDEVDDFLWVMESNHVEIERDHPRPVYGRVRIRRDAPPVEGYGTRGASPAARSAIEALETFEVGSSEEEEEEERVCAVCTDAMVMGEIGKKLPCGHYYHENCILPWLRRRNSCPLCRFQLQT